MDVEAVWRAEQAIIDKLYDQTADVAERRETMTGSPWYWNDARYDHWAVGLVTCVGDNGRIHYCRAGELVMTACEINQQPVNLRLLDGPIRIVDCRLCAEAARKDRDLIHQRHVQNIIKSYDRMNFVRRDQVVKRP